MNALIGDVGGTNIRLAVLRLDMKTRTSTVIKPITKISSQGVESLNVAIQQFLKDFKGDEENWPEVGCIGMAGPVEDNKVWMTNVTKWPICAGTQIAQECNMKEVKLINDFAANAYGLD